RMHLPERCRRRVEPLAIGAGALLHPDRAARGPVGGRRLQAREVHADPVRHYAVELGLDGGIARGNQDPDARPPVEHQAEPSGAGGGAAGSPTMRTKFATRAGPWKVPTRSVRTFTANSRERAFAYGRVVQMAS